MTTTYQKFLKRWEQVVDLPPQDLGPLTPYYKWLARVVKTHSWLVLALCSLLLVFGLKILLGIRLTGLTSILQRGF